MNTFFATTLETVLNQALRLDPLSLQSLGTLTGKIIRIEVSGMNLQFNIFPDNQGVMVLGGYDGEVTTQVYGAPFTLSRLLLQRNSTLIDNPDVTVQGDAKAAQQLLSIFQNLQIDWEKQLAGWLGEMPAHQLTTLGRKSQTYANEQLLMLQRQVIEHLQKTHQFPMRTKVDSWFKSVESLQDDVARLEQRVWQLQQPPTATTLGT